MKSKAWVLVMIVLLLMPALLFSVSHAETTWAIQTVDSAVNVGYGTSLALDSFGNPHISYYDENAGFLKYAQWTGSAWSTQTIEPTVNPDVGAYTSLALDSNNYPHIAYCSIIL